MANTMTTYVKIVNLNEETFNKVKELFETEGENSSEVNVINHFTKLFDEEYDETDFTEREWMDENIGSKWIRIEFGDVEYTPEVDLILETAWNVPTEYIQKVVEVLNKLDKDIVAAKQKASQASSQARGVTTVIGVLERKADGAASKIDQLLSSL